MERIDYLLAACSEDTVTRQVSLKHDDARASYRLKKNTVKDSGEFKDVLVDYINHHYQTVYHCGPFPEARAANEAMRLFNGGIFRRSHLQYENLLSDAITGNGGGMRAILDKIADQIKMDEANDFIMEQFRVYVEPLEWQQKVEIIGQFIRNNQKHLSPLIDINTPERYAHNYKELIHTYLQSMDQISSIMRSM